MNAIKGILGGIRQADQKFNLIEDKDKIMIGVSGGKDSMLLCYALKLYMKFSCSNFMIYPTILDLGFPGFDAEPIKKYLESIGLSLNVIDASDVYPIMKANQKEGKHLPCSICSRMKKAAINKAAKSLKCNKVAFAHHGDDAIETLFMNEIYGGRVATFEPKMYLERSKITFIRPLILIRESEIISAIKEENIPVFSSHCPNDGYTMRTEIKDLLKDLYTKYPPSKENFLTMLSNYEKESLFTNKIYYKVEKLNLTLKPVIDKDSTLIETSIREKLGKINYNKEIVRLIIYQKNKPIGVTSYIWLDKYHVELKDLLLLKESDEIFTTILNYLEIQFSRKICPLTILIKDKKHKNIYLARGYHSVNKYYQKEYLLNDKK